MRLRLCVSEYYGLFGLEGGFNCCQTLTRQRCPEMVNDAKGDLLCIYEPQFPYSLMAFTFKDHSCINQDQDLEKCLRRSSACTSIRAQVWISHKKPSSLS